MRRESPARYALQLAPGPSFSGAVTFSCSGAPLGATCAANTAAIAVSSASAVPFQVTVKTSGSAIVVPPEFVNPGIQLRFAVEAVLVALICLLLPINASRKESRFFARVAIRFGGFAAVAGILLFHLSGCGGAGGTTLPVTQIVTAPGMSAITVTATSGGVTPQTIQLTLTVH